MKSDVIKISREQDNLNKILSETQRTSEYVGLNAKQVIKTRLIAEEFVGMLDVIFSEAYAAVEAVDFSDFEYRTGNRCGGPRGQAHKSGRRYKEIRREIVGCRPG